MLASPHYGEQMAIWWLDAARYSDTNGYQTDGVRTMWPWRDWVVRAFNGNEPFDQFTIEQIGGDMLPHATLDQKIATAFNRNNRTTAEGGSVEEEFLAEYAADRVATTSTVWLGLTMGCARCHDHKYDPLKQKEFYQLFAYFDNMPERGLVYNFGNDKPMIPAPSPEQQQKLAELDGVVAKAEDALDEPRSPDRRGRPEMGGRAGALAPGGRLGPAEGWHITRRSTSGKIEFVEPKPKPEDEKKDEVDTRKMAGDNKPDAKQQRQPGPRTVELAEGKFGGAAALGEHRYAEAGDVAGFDYNEPFSFSFWIYPESPDGAIFNRMEDAKDPQGPRAVPGGWKAALRADDALHRPEHARRGETAARDAPLAACCGDLHGRAAELGGDAFLRGRRAARIRCRVGRPQVADSVFDALPDRRWRRTAELEGRLDELRIYKRVLDASEVGILAEPESVNQIAAIGEAKRSERQSDKLRRAYLDLAAPEDARQAIAALTTAREQRREFYGDHPDRDGHAGARGPPPTLRAQARRLRQPGELKSSPACRRCCRRCGRNGRTTAWAWRAGWSTAPIR